MAQRGSAAAGTPPSKVGTARCAVRAPSGRKGPAALPPGTAQRASLPSKIPAALPPGTARRAVPTRQDSGGFTAGDGETHRPYPARFRRLYRRGRRSAPALPSKIPAALPPGTARRAVPTWNRQKGKKRAAPKSGSCENKNNGIRRLTPFCGEPRATRPSPNHPTPSSWAPEPHYHGERA